MKSSRYPYILAFIVVTAFCGKATAQDDGFTGSDLGSGTGSYTQTFKTQPGVILTQFWEVPTLLNPGAVGDIDYIRGRVAGRLDFLGSHDSPKYFIATADAPFKLLDKRVGAGLVVNSGSYDLWRNLLLAAQGSYQFKIKNSKLSVGIQIGYFTSKFKGSDLVLYRQDAGNVTPGGEGNTEAGDGETEAGDTDDSGDLSTDMMLPTEDVEAGVFDLALGVRYEHPLFHVGVSVQHLTNMTMKLTREGASASDSRYLENKLPMTLYFEAGGNIGIKNSLFTLQPSLMVATEFSDFDAVVAMRSTYNHKITFGLDYRWNRAAGVFAGLYIKDFYVGYNWEYDYSASPKGSTGNHELVLGYQFKMDMGGKNNFAHRSIRIM